MSNLTCPGCGSVYPLSAVSSMDRFQCAVCHQMIVVPLAGPSAARVLPVVQPVQPGTAPAAPPPRPSAPSHPPRRAPHRRPHGHARPAAARRTGVSPGLVLAAIAVVAVGVMAAVLLSSHGGDAPPETATGAPAPSPPPPPPPKPEPPKADPLKDPEAWKALPAGERADRATKYLVAIDRRSGDQLSSAFTFFRQRGEEDAMKRVAEMEFERDPTSGWARQARGDEIVGGTVDRCLAECVRAEEADTPAVRKLAAISKASRPAHGSWWMDAAAKKNLDAVLADVRADESRLKDPYEWAVAKWDVYQRRIEVMKDFPSISSAAGPYVVFAQLRAAPGTPLDQVGAVETARARRVIGQQTTLLLDVYEGFLATFGAPLSLVRYDRTNVDEKSIQKVNVFPDEESWKRYHARIGESGWTDKRLAYYWFDEPRFLVTYDVTGANADRADLERCREAVLQLLHFYSWDATRRNGGGELAWAQCEPLPLSIELGVADFFASHRSDQGHTVWMCPDDSMMEDVWVFTQVAQKKRWAMWGLDELLSVEDMQDMRARATRRVLPRPVAEMTKEQAAEAKVARQVLGLLYFSKAWSLVNYLWSAVGTDGKPLYRDRFLAFLADGLRVKPGAPRTSNGMTKRLGPKEFGAAMGFASPAEFGTFERAWLAWESATFSKCVTVSWMKLLDEWMRSIGAK